MTKVEIALIFDLYNTPEEKLGSVDNIIREKVYKCDEEKYSSFCETMEEKGYYGVRLYPFCAKSEDKEDLKKALAWISDNSEIIKEIYKDTGVNIQLVIKFLVKNDLMSILGLFAGYPLELIFSPDDLASLKEHNIELKLTAEYADYIDDDDDDDGDEDEEDDEDDDFPDFDDYEGGIDIDNQDFTIKSGTLKEYKGAGGDVVIPEGTKAIGWRVFENHQNITSVTIPDGVEKIGFSAFYGCRNLSSVTIPESVTQIERAAFSGCNNLKDITIPNSVKEIDGEAFVGCKSLTSIVIPDGISSIADFTFSDCEGLVSFKVPDSVTEIDCCAFVRCTNLTDIFIPESVTDIADNAFHDCDNLTIHAPAGSCAEEYAEDNNIPFVAI